MKCNLCNYENKEENIYCEKCGLKLSQVEQVPFEDIPIPKTKAHICGYIAICCVFVFSCVPFVGQIITFVFSIIAIVKGLVNRDKINIKKCNIGLILGVCSLVIALLIFIGWIELIKELINNPDISFGNYNGIFVSKIKELS